MRILRAFTIPSWQKLPIDTGLEVVYEGTFTADTASDFSVQLTGAQTAGADLVFLPIYYQPASVIFCARPRPWAMLPPSSAWTAWTAS